MGTHETLLAYLVRRLLENGANTSFVNRIVDEKAPLDAIPDLSDPQVIVFTEWMGRSPTLVEDQVTYPLVTALLGAPHVVDVRGQTMFGMSFVYVVFEEGTDLYWARTRVLEIVPSASDTSGSARASNPRRFHSAESSDT